MFMVEPRSIWIHCGSLARLDQRVPVALPSTARFGVVPAFSLEEEVAVRFRATLVVPQPAGADVLVTVGVRVRVAVGPMAVRVRVAVGPTGVLVRVAVRVAVGPTAVLVRVAVGAVPEVP